MRTTLRCPHRQVVTDPAAMRSLMGEYAATISWGVVRDTLLASGLCPACPSEDLDPEPVTLYGQQREALRCPCCQALWVIEDPSGYTALATGLLREAKR